MFDRLHKHVTERQVRYTMLIIILGYAGFAFTWAMTDSVDAYLPAITPLLALAACVSVAVFMFRPRPSVYRASGWLITTALMARIAQVLLNMMYGTAYLSNWTGAASIVTLVFLTFMVGKTWDHDVRRWMKEENARYGH